MPDIATISAVLASVKTATEIAKFIRESDASLEKAELKLKLAELIGALAEVKIELAEIQESLASKDQRISELEEAFHLKDTIVRKGDAYYRLGADGGPIGVPFCLGCWERNHKLRQLVRETKEPRIRVCTQCGHKFDGMLAGTIAAPVSEPDGPK